MVPKESGFNQSEMASGKCVRRVDVFHAFFASTCGCNNNAIVNLTAAKPWRWVPK